MLSEKNEKQSLDDTNATSPTPFSLNSQNQERQNPAAPNDDLAPGGKRAWLRAFGGFLAFITVWGFPLGYGVFQSFYSLEYLRDESASKVAWIGTVQNFLVSMVSVLSGPIYDWGYYRALVYTGSLLSVFGIMMLSLSRQYYQLFLSHVCNGIGSGLLYVPILALVTQSHDKTRSLAMGFVASGIALGGILYTIIFLELQRLIGFPWTIRTIGFIALVLYCGAIPLLLSGPSLKAPGKARRLLDLSAIKSPAWLAYTAAQTISFWGYLIPMFYIPTFASVSLHTPASTGNWLLVAVQGASLVGRLGSAFTAHHAGVMLPLTICIFLSGVVSLAWLGIHNLAGFAIYTVVYGLFSGALISLPPSVFPLAVERKELQGTWLGMAWATNSLASLTGAPIAGTFVNLQTGDLRGAQIWGGVLLLTGAALFGLLWVVLSKKKGKIWI